MCVLQRKSVVLKTLLPLAALATSPAMADTAQAIGSRAAIAKSDKTGRDIVGRFEMVVAATGKATTAVYLNSDADYRAPGDVTFRLAPYVARAVLKRYGGTSERWFVGKRIVVDGTLRREPIVNTAYGRVVSANRWQHVVRVLFARQIVSVE